MATTDKKSTRKSEGKSGAQKHGTPERAKDGRFKKDGGHWGTAAIVGGVAAVGAVATAALFALRGSSANDTPEDTFGGPHETAHQPDGSGSSASYDARIADEGTVPA